MWWTLFFSFVVALLRWLLENQNVIAPKEEARYQRAYVLFKTGVQKMEAKGVRVPVGYTIDEAMRG